MRSPTRHDTGRWRKTSSPECVGYVVEGGGVTVHHAGDVDFSDHRVFDDIGKRFAIDATLLPIGGMMPVWYYRSRRARMDQGVHIDPDCALDIYERLGAKALVPVHWGTLHLRLGLPSMPRRRLAKIALARDASGVHILVHGERLALADTRRHARAALVVRQDLVARRGARRRRRSSRVPRHHSSLPSPARGAQRVIEIQSASTRRRSRSDLENAQRRCRRALQAPRVRARGRARCAPPHDPSLEANAQLYDQLARAWDRAFAPDATPVARFEALRYARRIDLALGGYYADELDAHLRETAPLAATIYATRPQSRRSRARAHDLRCARRSGRPARRRASLAGPDTSEMDFVDHVADGSCTGAGGPVVDRRVVAGGDERGPVVRVRVLRLRRDLVLDRRAARSCAPGRP